MNGITVIRDNKAYWVDLDSGEILDKDRLQERRHYKTDEVTIYEKVLADISRARPLTGEGYRILLYLFSQVDETNHIPGTRATSEAIGLAQANVSRAYRQMLRDGYLLQDGKGYSIHPFICYYGSKWQREATLKKLFNNLPLVS